MHSTLFIEQDDEQKLSYTTIIPIMSGKYHDSYIRLHHRLIASLVAFTIRIDSEQVSEHFAPKLQPP